MDSTRTTDASPPYFRIAAASHWNRSSLLALPGKKYPEFPSGTVPYRWSFRQISTLWLARFVGSVNVSNSQPAGRLSRTVISLRCYVYNSEKVKSAYCGDLVGSPDMGSPDRTRRDKNRIGCGLFDGRIGRRLLADDPKLLPQSVLFGRQRHELFVPEPGPLGFRKRGHCMYRGYLSLRDFVDLAHQIDDLRHILPGLE